MSKRKTPEERFWSSVLVGPGCWLWTGRERRKNGYGRFYFEGKTRTATHVMWFFSRGEWLSTGENALHTCDVPACVRPSHLFRGTHVDNVADRVAKGRSATGERHASAKLTRAIVLDARARVASGETVSALARELKVSNGTMWRAVFGATWKGEV